MDKSRWGVHTSHCCVIHGCKYRDEDCPVITEQAKQEYTCESCGYDGFKTLQDVENLQLLKQQVRNAKENGDTITQVSVESLSKLLQQF